MRYKSIEADVITARRICVEDSEGNRRINLGFNGDGDAVIGITNAEGQLRWGVQVKENDEVSMAFLSGDNVQQMHFEVSASANGFSIRDRDGITRAALSMDEDPGLILFDPDGRMKLMLIVHDVLPKILVRDNQGETFLYPQSPSTSSE